MPDPAQDPTVSSPRLRKVALRRLVTRFIFVGLLVFAGFWAASIARGQTPLDEIGTTANHRPEINLILVFFGLLVLSAATAGAETAIFSLNKLDLVHARGRPSRTTRAVIHLLDHPNDTLTTLLVMNMGVNIALSLTAGALADIIFGGAEAAGYAIAAFFTTVFLLVFGEVIPKTVSHFRARVVAKLVAVPTLLLSILFTPIRSVINRFIKWVFHHLKVPESRITELVSEEELKAMINTREVSTLLEEDEREMIHSVFDLRHTFADEIMVPRTEVTSFSISLTQDEILARLRETPHSRVLIYRVNLDHLEGYILAKEVLLEPERDWREAIREAPLLPMKVRLVDLLEQFRRLPMKIAVLVDEYGGVAGIVTLHDLLEEIVGDIRELHEPLEQDFVSVGPAHWRIRGRMNIAELSDKLRVKLSEEMGKTAAGFVMNSLGHVPQPGEEMRHDGFVFKVTRMAGRRIVQIDIIQEPEPAAVVAAESREEGA